MAYLAVTALKPTLTFAGWPRRCLCLLPMVVSLLTVSPVWCAQPSDWRAWESFCQRFIQADGRVVEHEFNSRTTSEAQAYAMFFALVNNQPQLFAQLLEWTVNNLAGGDLELRLPGWLWGQANRRSESGTPARWTLLDENPASDADLWLAYTLLEAGRLWQRPLYDSLGRSVLSQISRKETLRLSDDVVLLLPAERGFQISQYRWRINPSYYMPQQFALFSRIDPSGPWQALGQQLPAMLASCCPSGHVPDWLTYHDSDGWREDKGGQLVGSYDAIRVYLWAGMMNDRQPGRASLLGALHGMRMQIRRLGEPPERIDVKTGKASGSAPPGFVAAVAPYLAALGEKALLARSLQQLQALESGGLLGHRQRYYDQVLALFGLGYIEQRYRFSQCGELMPAWSVSPSACRPQNTAENAMPP